MTERVFIFFLERYNNVHTYTIFKYKHTGCILCLYIDKKTSFLKEIKTHLCTNNKTYLNNSWYVLNVIVISVGDFPGGRRLVTSANTDQIYSTPT